MSNRDKLKPHGEQSHVSLIKQNAPLFGDNVITSKKTDADGRPMNVSPLSVPLSHLQDDINP